MNAPEILHATLMADWTDGRWKGALVRGPSGAGKSALALRCLQLGFRLVADDRVLVWRSGEALYGKAPASLYGLLEVRGVGIIDVSSPLSMARIALVVDAEPAPERHPDPAVFTILGMDIPVLALAHDHPDTPLRVRVGLAAAQHRL